jgi:SAM-dependent methyltransferase
MKEGKRIADDTMSRSESTGRAAWDRHWESLRTSRTLFGRIASIVRTQLLSRAVRHYAARFFTERGIFVEAGCGTAQSSGRLGELRRRLVALDFSPFALNESRHVPVFAGSVQGDIRRLPFRDGSVAGIWNLGVMEHFSEKNGLAILVEFRRVLESGGVVVLFWPPEFGLSRLILAPVERILSWRRSPPFAFFPDEVNRLRSREHARRTLTDAGFNAAAVDFSFRDLFIHLVVVGRKPKA